MVIFPAGFMTIPPDTLYIVHRAYFVNRKVIKNIYSIVKSMVFFVKCAINYIIV